MKIRICLFFIALILITSCSEKEIDNEITSDSIVETRANRTTRLSGESLIFYNTIEPMMLNSELSSMPAYFTNIYGVPNWDNVLISANPNISNSFHANLPFVRNGLVTSYFKVTILNNTHKIYFSRS